MLKLCNDRSDEINYDFEQDTEICQENLDLKKEILKLKRHLDMIREELKNRKVRLDLEFKSQQ